MRTKFLVTILVLLALALPASPVHAGGVVNVCDEAHLLAALAGGGTVTFSCSGTISLTAEIVINADTTIDGSGQTVTISGNNAVRVCTVNAGVTVNLNELTIADGSAALSGGVYNNNGYVIVTNSIFSGNRATNGGGGIYNWWGTLTVSNSTFSENSVSASWGQGGGIFNGYGTVTIGNSWFYANSAPHEGGGIYNYNGTLIVSNSTFSDNSVSAGQGWGGGGVFNGNGTATIDNSTFSGNTASNVGGGIRNREGTLTVSNSTFFGNSASSSAGILNYSFSGPLTISNSTFSSNSAGQQGGGIWNGGGAATVSNSTFSTNSANQAGGGIHCDSGTVTLMNAIVANSLTGSNCYGTITDGGGNLSFPDTTCPGINANPVLGPLQDNGGPTQTMALLPGSAAIDAAVDATCAAAPVNGLDQRGIARPQGAHCDIGAVERYCPNFVPPQTVGVEDIVAIATRWGWTDTTPDWDPAYDLNGDNRIDIVDILLVTRVWGGTCS